MALEKYKNKTVYKILAGANDAVPDYSIFIDDFNINFDFTVDERIYSTSHRVTIKISFDALIKTNLEDHKITIKIPDLSIMTITVNSLTLEQSNTRAFYETYRNIDVGKLVDFSNVDIRLRSASTNRLLHSELELDLNGRAGIGLTGFQNPTFIPLARYDLQWDINMEIWTNSSKITTLAVEKGFRYEYYVGPGQINIESWKFTALEGLQVLHGNNYEVKTSEGESCYFRFSDSIGNHKTKIYKYDWQNGQNNHDIITPVVVSDFPVEAIHWIDVGDDNHFKKA